MTVYYEGVDITTRVIVRSCDVRDTAGGRADSVEIVFEDAGRWQKWQPQEDDRIAVTHQSYSSGTMYVNTVTPEDGRYRILATSLPCAARRREWRSYNNKTLGEIMEDCALRTGMQYAMYGIDRGLRIRYIEQEYESAAAFLCRLLRMEGAAFKCVQGKYTAIGIEWAQRRDAGTSLRITADQWGTQYRRSGETLRRLSVQLTSGQVSATDMNVKETHPSMVKSGLPVSDAPQAGRWARGLLLNHNRECERLCMDMKYSPAMTAMARVNVTGGTDADGAWLVEEAHHELIEETTFIDMRKCVYGII